MMETNLFFENFDKNFIIIHDDNYDINFLTSYKPLLDILNNLHSKNGIVTQNYGTLQNIIVKNIIKFGNNIGFVLFDINIIDINNNRIPGIVFSRNNSVAILVTSIFKGIEYCLLVVQPRTSTGLFYSEVVAGIIENHDIKGNIIRELKEEANISINYDSLNYLGNTMPSCGACNEVIELYHTYVPDLVPLVKNANNNIFGNTSEAEITKRTVIMLKDILTFTNDSKSHLCYYYYKSNLKLRINMFLCYYLDLIFNFLKSFKIY